MHKIIEKCRLSNKKIIAIIVLIMIAFMIVCGAKIIKIVEYGEKVQKDFVYDVDDLQITGYKVEEDRFTNISGDVQIEIPDLNTEIAVITIDFLEETEQSMMVVVSLDEYKNGYQIPENAKRYELALETPAEITDLEVNISTNEGEYFELDQIRINDSERVDIIVGVNVFQWVMIFLFVTVLLVGGYIVFIKKINIQTLFLFVGISISILYMIVMTPYSIPDELHHYCSSYKVSNIMMLQWNDIDQGAGEHFDVDDFAKHYNTRSGYEEVLHRIGDTTSIVGNIEVPKPNSISYPIEYIPQAIGISIGRILGLNDMFIFYLGRLCNALFYVSCVYFAIMRVTYFKSLFFMVGLLPMNMHQAASYSYDGFINGIAMLLIACILSAIWEKGELQKRDKRNITVLSVLLAPSKVIYILILMLLVLIPKERFKTTREYIFVITGPIVVSMLAILVFNGPRLLGLTEVAEVANWHGGVNYSVKFVLEHPITTLRIFRDTLIEQWEFYFYGTFGWVLSGCSLKIPRIIIQFYIIILSCGALTKQKESIFINLREKIVMLMICSGVVALAMMSMFLVWTPDTSTVVLGVQGRYFLPVVPLFCLLINNKSIQVIKDIDKYLIMASMSLNVYVLYYILNVTVR